jgi:transposase
MFLRRYHRTKDGKSHTYFALVESVRTQAGPRQRVVAQLGELSEDEQHRWQRTAVFHTRESGAPQLNLFDAAGAAGAAGDPSEASEAGVVRVRLGKVGWTNARAFGDVWLGLRLWQMLGLDRIVGRHLPVGRETVPPATMVAIEVISRLCIGQGGETSELGLAECGYRRTALEDLLGVPDEQVTKDRLYRTLDALIGAKDAIEADVRERLGTLFDLKFDLVLCDLTSSFFEGLAEDNDLAARGYSRDHRGDCKQVVLAMDFGELSRAVVSVEGFPFWHEVYPGNKTDNAALPGVVDAVSAKFGSLRRVWVVDRGLATKKAVQYLRDQKQSFLVGTPKGMLEEFEAQWCTADWTLVRPQVQVKVVQKDGEAYVLARSWLRRKKERAMRRRQLHGLRDDLRGLAARVASGRLKDPDKVQQAVGRLAERWPAAWRFVEVTVTPPTPTTTPAPPAAEGEMDGKGERNGKSEKSEESEKSEKSVKSRPGTATSTVSWVWDRSRLKGAMSRDGAYLLLSNQTDWTAEQLWTTYVQLTRAEDAFRTLKSQEMLRPIWHQTAGRVKAHVFVCVLAYLLWKALEQMLRGAGVMTCVGKSDEQRGEAPPCPPTSPPPGSASPQDRPMSVATALKLMHDIQVGDILLETVEGRNLRLRRVARPNAEQAELLAALKLELPERLTSDVEAPAPTAATAAPQRVEVAKCSEDL